MLNRIENARAAQPSWAALSVGQRVRQLKPLRHVLADQMDRIIATISEEVGKPPLDALAGDMLVTLEHMRYCERTAEKALRPRSAGKPSLLYRGAEFRETLEPHGVALILAPWNYPLQLAMVPMVTALFAGNSVVLKCSEHTPRTAAFIQQLVREARLPEGLVQVCWDGPEAASLLIEQRPGFIFFTGSSSNGRAVAQHAARLLIPTVLELGGKDACLVFDSCDLKRSVEGVTYGAFSNAGQVCVGIKRLYIQRGIFSEFLTAFVVRARQVRIGLGLDSDMGEVRFQTVRQRLAEQVDDALAHGATLHTEWDRQAAHVPPLILSGLAPDARLLMEETFGPVVCIDAFDDELDAIRKANDCEFALSASVYTGDPVQAQRVAGALSAGSCSVNDSIRQIGNPYAAFGGNRASGYGRYHGVHGLHAFSRVKSVMTVRRPQSVEVHWFPFNAKTFGQVRGFLRWRHCAGTVLSRMKKALFNK